MSTASSALNGFKVNRLTLSFPRETEELFREEYFRKSIKQIRIALVLAIFFYGLFGFLDPITFPEQRGIFWFIRYAVLCPLALFVFLFSYSSYFKRYMQLAIVSVLLVGGLGIIAMILIAPEPRSSLYHAGVILVFLYGYTFFKLRFVWATLAGFMIIAAYEIAAIWLSQTPISILVNTNFFFLAGNFIGMFACYSIEFYLRKDFTQARLLEVEREKVGAANLELEKRVEERTAQLVQANRELKQEIADRERAQVELKQSEEKYRTILASIEEAYYEVDIAGKITFFNDSVARMLGYSKHELTGMNYRTFTDMETAEKVYEAFNGVYTSGHPTHEVDWEVIGKDGTKRYVEASVSLIKDSEGRRIGFRGVVRDITEQKVAEKEKKKLEAQLQQAQKMEAIGTLAGGVAHDFKNILQTIMSYSQIMLIKKEPGDPEISKLKAIEKSVGRASDLANRLLIFSRKVESNLGPVDLNHEVSEVSRILRRTIPKMISVETQVEEELGIINADTGQLEQVMINLAVNARDAMPEGGKLTFETRNVTLDEDYCKNHLGVTPGDYVLLRVSDTGNGMSEEIREHIFEPFFTTKETGEGTGLGLAMTYGIVKSHHGYITCDSGPGKGTTFEIYFPVLEEADEFDFDEEEFKIPVKTGNETILLVDDEKDILDLGKEILTSFGYELITAQDGESALDLYKRKCDRIHLIMLDLIMPGMGGAQCLERLLEINPEAKVIIVSGHTAKGPSKKLIEKRAKGFVGKPYDTRKILSLIREVLDAGC